jgi:hypothetical protein
LVSEYTTRWVAALLPAAALAHNLTITQVLVSFDQPGTVNIKIDIDLSARLASPDAYYALSIAPAETQRAAVEKLVPGILDSLQLEVGEERLKPILQDFALPTLSQADFSDPAVDHFTTFNFIAVLPAQRDPLKLVVPYTAKVDYPNQLSAFSLVHAFQFYLSIPPHKEDFKLTHYPIPCSVAIALVGIFWAVQRVIFYRHLY